MPFAKKFRAMMDLPLSGETLGDFAVEEIDVWDEPGSAGQYAYGVRMTLRGPGGQQGVRRALRELLSAQPTTFSGYGNPYQLWFGSPEIEALGDKRYAVSLRGAGARIRLAPELARFLRYLQDGGMLARPLDAGAGQEAVDTYLERYRGEIRRQVDRYRRRLSSADRAGGRT